MRSEERGGLREERHLRVEYEGVRGQDSSVQVEGDAGHGLRTGHHLETTLHHLDTTSICRHESRTTFWRFLQVTSRAALVTALLAIWSPSFST